MNISYSYLLMVVLYAPSFVYADSNSITNANIGPREQWELDAQKSDYYIQLNNRYNVVINDVRSGKKNANYVDDSGLTALHMAIRFGTLDDVRFLVEKGSDVLSTSAGVNPVFVTVDNTCLPKKLSFLLKHGIPADYGERGLYLIHMAASNGENTECLKVLLESNVNVNMTDMLGRNAYFFANSEEIVQLLYAAGADLFQKNVWGIDAIHYSILMNNEEIFVDVLKKELDKNKAKKQSGSEHSFR